MLIDSDKRTESDPINDTKERICKEIEEINGLSWITSGREVENYIPKIAVSKLYNIEVQKDLGLYDSFWSYLNEIKPGEGSKFSQKKVMFAEKIRPYLDRQDLSTTSDMEKRMVEIIERIRKWNNIT